MHKYFLKSSKLWLELPLHNPGHLKKHNDLFKKCEADAEVAYPPKMHKVCFQKLKLRLELHTSKANPNPTQANPSQSKSITKLTQPKPNQSQHSPSQSQSQPKPKQTRPKANTTKAKANPTQNQPNSTHPNLASPNLTDTSYKLRHIFVRNRFV